MVPGTAYATECGAGEDLCTAAESPGYDKFCFDLWVIKLCFDVTYYLPPEPPPVVGPPG